MKPLSDEVQSVLSERDLLQTGQLLHAMLALRTDVRRHLEDDKVITGFEAALVALTNFSTLKDAVIGIADIPSELQKLSASDVEFLADLFFDHATEDMAARQIESIDRAIALAIAAVHFIDWQLHPAPRPKIVPE